MFAAVDVHYPPSGGARAALVLAPDAAFSTIVSEKTVLVEHVAPSQSLLDRSPSPAMPMTKFPAADDRRPGSGLAPKQD
jgi:hypothetical protein